MDVLGYEYVRTTLGLKSSAPAKPALIKPVTSILATPSYLAVPTAHAFDSLDPVDHLLFALKHEGVNLQILAEALEHVSADSMLTQLRKRPNGQYVRTLAALWEALTGRVLEGAPAVGGAQVKLFDPDRYITGPGVKLGRWRVLFNGLGTIRYCATVERTAAINSAIGKDIPGRLDDFLESLGGTLLDRALEWAYLHETRSSFAIERETPNEEKATTFMHLLRQAHERQPLSEDYLAALQSAVVANAFDRAFAFRDRQNWLEGPGRGTSAVTYVPPTPELARDLMGELMGFANAQIGGVDPVVKASVISFAFVYVHPFMDGNGRLSRFLFHHALCRAGALKNGLVLPVSIAMKKHEDEYLRVLQTYSRPQRQQWRVQWIDEGKYTFEFVGHEASFRYWDATPHVEFGCRMAEEALEVELRQETEFLTRFDAIRKGVNERFDVRGSDLSTLIRTCLDNNGVLSRRRRDQFAERVPEEVFELIQQLAKSS